ncbi:MAG: hypothetical protein IJY24_02380 [Clostridia bacterium]|nr:hypothetical protein [Clostridia bacterium]
MKSKRYTISAYWLLTVAIGTIINILLISIFGTALPVGSHIAWSALFTGLGLATSESSIFLVAAIFMSIFVAAPFLICFIQALKRGRAMLLGLIIYALDTVMLVADLIYISNTAVRIFLIISLVIHLAGIALLAYGSYLGIKDEGSQSAVRTLYIRRARDGFGSQRLNCRLNGAFMCTLEPGEERLVVVDRHRQRLSVSLFGAAPAELVLPSGANNVSVIISLEYINGQSKIIISSNDSSV